VAPVIYPDAAAWVGVGSDPPLEPHL
jgi:hypothetical protein